jgi:hypothetical protein
LIRDKRQIKFDATINKLTIGFDATKTDKLKKDNENTFSVFGLSKTVKIPELQKASPGGPILHYLQVDNGELREIYEIYSDELSVSLPVELTDGPHIITYTNNDFSEWKVFLNVNGRHIARVYDNIGSVKFRIVKNVVVPIPQYFKALTSRDVSRARLSGISVQQ